jgi:PLP dependent protein
MNLSERIQELRERIVLATAKYGRTDLPVELMLATKTQPIDILEEAVAAGCTLFGENRAQELVTKAPQLMAHNVQWQFIGSLQTNKVKDVLRYSRCIQSVDRLSLVQELAKHPASAITVMVEVNTSGEPNKAGCEPEAVPELLGSIAEVPHVYVAGFMTVGALSRNEHVVRSCFSALRTIRDTSIEQGFVTRGAQGLSMGMSSDLEWAIAEGSTMVRVGSAVFGDRA